MTVGGPVAFVRSLKAHRPVAIAAAVALVVVVVGAGIAVAVGIAGSGASPSPSPSQIALATSTPEPTLAPTIEPTPSATPLPTPTGTPLPPAMVAATTDGVLLPADQRAVATRKPIAVMIDDHWGARPQSGLSMADIVYQGPAEGGIPRYMAIFQTQEPPAIGPIRSARYYFVAWAEEYRAAYVHMWGAPNAMGRLAQDTGKYIWNIDGLRYGGMSGYMWRTAFRISPHNLYTSFAKLEALTRRLGGTDPLTKSPFIFTDDQSVRTRSQGLTITIPYSYNHVVYAYDYKTNTYPRTVTQEGPQYDAATGLRIAPSNVILLYMNSGLAATTPAQVHKHRLEVQYLGHGTAMVFNNGLSIPAVWTKKGEYSPTVITYAVGPNKGKQIPMVRGQIFIQIVSSGVLASWTPGQPVAPEPQP
jgi:hypothetical protein